MTHFIGFQMILWLSTALNSSSKVVIETVAVVVFRMELLFVFPETTWEMPYRWGRRTVGFIPLRQLLESILLNPKKMEDRNFLRKSHWLPPGFQSPKLNLTECITSKYAILPSYPSYSKVRSSKSCLDAWNERHPLSSFTGLTSFFFPIWYWDFWEITMQIIDAEKHFALWLF